jgi:hypothetical protein
MKCQNCGKHEGTENWVGESGFLAFSHGFYQVWCKCCVIKEQLKYCKKMSKALPKLEKKLKVIKCQ